MTKLIALHNEVKTLNSKIEKPQICSRVLSTKLPLNPDPELPILPDCRSNKEWNKDKGRCGRSLACQSGCEQLHLAPLSPTEPRPLVPLGWKSNETQFHSSRGVSLRTSHTFKPCTRQEQTYIEDVFSMSFNVWKHMSMDSSCTIHKSSTWWGCLKDQAIEFILTICFILPQPYLRLLMLVTASNLLNPNVTISPHSEISVTTHFHISIISKKPHKPPLFSAIPAVPSGQNLFSPPSQPLVLHFYQSTINSTFPTIQHTTNSAFNTFCSTVFWKHHPLCSKPKTDTNLEQTEIQRARWKFTWPWRIWKCVTATQWTLGPSTIEWSHNTK